MNGFVDNCLEHSNRCIRRNVVPKDTATKKGFLIVDETTYAEIADYLISNDPNGVADLIYLLLEKKPELHQEIKSWKGV